MALACRRLLAPALRLVPIALVLGVCAGQPVYASQDTAALAENDGQTAYTELLASIHIPYERFTLKNGLTVLVHTDRKAPIVGVTTYYRVGSRHEPRGRTGFAHLFEHLFFGGSANAPDFDQPLENAGSTATNGSTWYDRTNYIETVPTGALELALFLESDRMGHLLPAISQDKLDKQRGVVQNEKRQNDNQPYGLASYAVSEGLFPVGHPYRHSTIGSMADLDSASLGDVRDWFHAHYGPNNAILVLTGDIDAKTARPLVEKWFGKIPGGPAVPGTPAEPVTLSAPIQRDMADQVPVLRLSRNWSGPAINAADIPALSVGFDILGGLTSSRLDNALVRDDQLAVAVSASIQTHEYVSIMSVQMDVRPGVNRRQAEARLDQVIADFVKNGPSEDEVRRAVTSILSSQIGALERVGGFYGKGVILAEGDLYSSNPAQYRKDLEAMTRLTPQDIQTAMQRWLERPAFSLAVVPGQRVEDGAEMGGWGDKTAALPADPKTPIKPAPAGKKRVPPPVAPVGKLNFPQSKHALLSNGMPVTLVRRTAIPKVLITLDIDAGYAADALDSPGTQGLMLAMLDEGTTTLNSRQIAEAQERLGAQISTGASLDTSQIMMSALSVNIAPSLELMADIARNPAFASTEVARLQKQRLASLAQTLANPRALASRELNAMLFGPHPYAQPADGLGNIESVEKLTPDMLRRAHSKWIRPDLASITAVGDISMDALLPLLEKSFGTWEKPQGTAPVKPINAAVPPANPRIIVIDRPNSPQSVIYAGQVLPVTGMTPDLDALDLANQVLGGDFLSRLNMDLREDKGWSYGVSSAVREPKGPRQFIVAAPVQADRTGDAITAILEQIRAFPNGKPITADELTRVINGQIRSLPSSFETNANVMGAVLTNQHLGRPDNYYETLPDRYRAIGAQEINNAAAKWLDANTLTFVIVGSQKQIASQLETLGMKVEFRTAPKEAAQQ